MFRLRGLTAAVSFVLTSVLVLTSSIGWGEVTLPHMLSDHAVLQRQMPIHLWGNADPGEKLNIVFHAQQLIAVADVLGHWSVYLQPEEAGGPYTLTVAGSNVVTARDVLVGDVWFASGQSNMEMPLAGFAGTAPLKNGAEEIAAATQPRIHLLHIGKTSSSYEHRDIEAVWTVCTPDTAKSFSAVAYFFGRDLQQKEAVPIGLIDSSWGGTPIASWIGLDALSADAGLLGELRARVPMVESEADLPALAAEEQREDNAAAKTGQPIPHHPWHPDPASYEPSALFNGMVAPATEYTIKGVLWYQGETDSSAERAPLYEQALPALITDWRARWGEGDFPFLVVQISSFTSTPAESWAVVREAQRRSLRLADTALVVTLDIGEPDNVHPADKQTVGARLALAARAMAYGEAVEGSGPLFREATRENAGMRIWFTHASGLAAKGGVLGGFEVAGSDRRYRPASAVIGTGALAGTVLVQAVDVANPEFVRYAWANAPSAANLVNGARLPASTFISERHIPAPCAAQCSR